MKKYSSVLNSDQVRFFQDEGYLILKDFVDPETVVSLRARVCELLEGFEPDELKTIFSTRDKTQPRNEYFLNSGDKICFFFEEDAIAPNGDLLQPKELSVNKIGHALHKLDPIFSNFSYQTLHLGIARDLGLEDPKIVQSMYIFKQPRIGGEVTCHQDGTFLYTHPDSTLGLWFALEEATQENGCLWAIPGAHKGPLKSRYRVKPDNSTCFEHYDSTPWDLNQMVPLDVPVGSLILLHSRLPHMSYMNRSTKSRHAYTLHLIDGKSDYPTDNWLKID